ncbi:MAG TPA: GrpB family protein [Casimicrobiaceae bacterium]|nr:GrpB family protein [Casimicrobiaceae bacterium]
MQPAACAAPADTHMKRNPPILPYTNSGAEYVEYDRAAIDVAAEVGALIEKAAPWAEVEHIGSTAIPGCAGKGIVDVMVMYPPHRLESTRGAIDALGFQPQKAGHIFPDDRPMRVGAIDHDGRRYQLHAHVIDMTSPEIDSLRRFRDLLRADSTLRNAYQEKKRTILQSGVREPRAYTQAKGEFITAVIGESARR